MKKRKILSGSLLILFTMFFVHQLLSQSQPLAVAGAEVQVKINNKTVKCGTDENGHFGILFSDIKAIETAGPDINVFFTIKPPKNFKNRINDNRAFIGLSKSEGPYFELVLYYNPSSGKFTVERDISTKSQPTSNKPQGIKRGKGDATKVGDKYMGTVAHF
ncbi:MAG: hypothetical protein H5U06_10105 [Candidatus Aminicenantes bacterium]|nr:hypothetical protein [Candidatus Aminicenantes bacterium]